MGAVGRWRLTELIALACFPGLSSFGMTSQFSLYIINKLFATNSNTLCPFVITTIPFTQVFVDPFFVIQPCLFLWTRTKQFHEFIIIYQNILFSGFLDFIVTTKRPLWRVGNDSGTHHIQFHIYKTTKKMVPALYCWCVIAILTECPLLLLSLLRLKHSSSWQPVPLSGTIWNNEQQTA